MLRKNVCWEFVLVVLLCWTTPLVAATYTVPDDFASIQDAIDHAGSGDTIRVRAGGYGENITLKSGVNVFGEGHEVTFLKGTGTVSVVRADDVYNAELNGFTIYNSGVGHSYAGVSIYGGSIVISNNRITRNNKGVRMVNGTIAIIRNNIIINNGDTDAVIDYGIICLHSTPLITNNLLIENQGVGIYFCWDESSGAQVINNTIVGNSREGVWCCISSPRIKNNIIVENGCGIAASHGGMPEISYNDVWNNSGKDYNSQSGGWPSRALVISQLIPSLILNTRAITSSARLPRALMPVIPIPSITT